MRFATLMIAGLALLGTPASAQEVTRGHDTAARRPPLIRGP